MRGLFHEMLHCKCSISACRIVCKARGVNTSRKTRRSAGIPSTDTGAVWAADGGGGWVIGSRDGTHADSLGVYAQGVAIKILWYVSFHRSAGRTSTAKRQFW